MLNSKKTMRFLYAFLYTCAFFLALPYFLVAGLVRGKYLSTVWQRFGNIPCRSDVPSIWIHAVSVGEFLACKTLIRRIQKLAPGIPVFVSTTTLTGQKLARQLLPEAAFYFPFDWSWCIRKVFRSLEPKVVFVMETEIWPNFLWTAQAAGIPVILINGRLSDRSIARYRLVRNVLPKFTESWMQTEEDAQRMRSLGADSVHVMGNLKYDLQSPVPTKELSSVITSWKKLNLLWIAGSTMSGEEDLVLDVFMNLKHEFPLKLLIAPRHPERFSEVADVVSGKGLEVTLRSHGKTENTDVMILDTIGELAGAYQFADIVLIGGTLLKTGGGHNPIEPAYFGKPIIAGPNFSNFRAVVQDFQKKNAILITDQLLAGMRDLLQNVEKRFRLGEAARTIVEENAGATDKVLDVLTRVLEQRAPAVLG
ncbi:3-deoxy-D-manno-octulosonic acid transferase [bacterium]|nr:3-deoxy-D-manno-octulosonic acid transferase [bacterium]